MGYNTKIDWCDTTWNPVTGCLHGCEYCYARGIANRFGGHEVEFGGQILSDNTLAMKRNKLHVLSKPWARFSDRKNPYPFDFDPTFHRYRLNQPEEWTEPRTIFVCSMADLFGEWVPDEWIREVFAACARAPQHRYLFLTKNPARYEKLAEQGIMPRWNESLNMWYGSTATTMDTPVYGNNLSRNTFISIEPILEPFLNLGSGAAIVDWIIVGAETGNRRNKVIPKREWIDEIIRSCERTNTPLFMKESLREIMGRDFRQEFPWEG